MENADPSNLDLPVIEKDKSGKRKFACWRGKQYGPWDELDEGFRYSPDKSRWATRGKLHDRHYVLSDRGRYGPFDLSIRQLSFDPARDAFIFTAGRGSEFMLLAEDKIIKKGTIVEKPSGESFIIVNRKRFGPFQDIHFPQFSLSGKKWAAEAWKEDKKAFLLLNGREHGPFEAVDRTEFGGAAETCACRCRCDRGEGLLIDGETFHGPYRNMFGPFFSPDGKRWGMDVKKNGKWFGFVVDGIEYGPFAFQFFVPRFSPDSRHWAVLLDGGYEDKPHSLILDGITYGPFDIRHFAFTADSHCLSLFRRKGNYFIFLDGREIGPYRHADKKIHAIGNAIIADLVFGKKNTRSVRRCVISYSPDESETQVIFSPSTGESLEEAIEIINVTDTAEGIAAEYAYLRLKSQSLGINYAMVEQQLIPRQGRQYDKLTVALEDGSLESYFFDITSFYGKSETRPKAEKSLLENQ